MKKKNTQSHHGNGQLQQTSNSYDVFSDIVEDQGEQEKKEMELLVIGSRHPTTFPNSPQPNHSSPHTFIDDVISSIQPLPTSSSPEFHQTGNIREERPGAYAMAGIRPIFRGPRSIRPLTGRIPDVEGLGLELELVPTSQNETDGDDRLIHADPIDDSENGMIPTAEPIATRARLWQKKLFLFLSLETLVAQVLVLIILVAFLLAPKSINQTQPSKQQNGVIPIQENQGTIASITQAPQFLSARLNLPDYTIRAMENPRSPQTKAYQWLSNNINNSNDTQQLPVWRLKQRFALATFYYSTRGDYWVKNQGWLDWDSNECSWAQILLFDPSPASYCDDNGQLLSLQYFYANNLDGTMPPEISLLCDSLETLRFAWNHQLKGNIPTEIGLMTRLTALGFSATHLSGTLSTEMGQLQSLEELIIAHSKLDGTLPTELGNLSKLGSLLTEGVNFSGSIPTEILQLSNLKTLIFSECPLLDTSSFLPQVVLNLHNLEMLSLDSQKTGEFKPIPSEIGRLTNLANLVLDDFQINGTIPSEMGLLTKLNYLYLERNSITGTLPEELSKMSQLKKLLISSNHLEGIPLEPELLPQLTQLQQLCINDNVFSGSIATEVGLWSSLKILELQDTNLSGTLPTELLLLDNLTSLVLMNTSLTGSIPDGLCGVRLLPHEMKRFGGNYYAVPTTNLSVCYGTNLCGCTCEQCPKK